MTPSRRGPDTPDDPLPDWLDRYVDYALPGLLAGTVLCLLAFVTNPVPDPSFPWATLPASLRLPVTQPRIEHWPVSYTAGIWLWIAGFPALFLAGYRRYARRWRWSSTAWLVALPTVAMVAWTTYCRFFWPKPSPATWNAPSYTLVCWAYCSSYVPFWSNAAYAVASFGLVATLLAARWADRSWPAVLAFGVLSFPLGIPAIYEGYRRYTGRSGSVAAPVPDPETPRGD